MLVAWVRRNCRQLVSVRRNGAGGIRWRCRIRRIIEAPTRWPSVSSSPWIRRYPECLHEPLTAESGQKPWLFYLRRTRPSLASTAFAGLYAAAVHEENGSQRLVRGCGRGADRRSDPGELRDGARVGTVRRSVGVRHSDHGTQQQATRQLHQPRGQRGPVPVTGTGIEHRARCHIQRGANDIVHQLRRTGLIEPGRSGGAARALNARQPGRPGTTCRTLRSLRSLRPVDALHTLFAGLALRTLQAPVALLTGLAEDT